MLIYWVGKSLFYDKESDVIKRYVLIIKIILNIGVIKYVIFNMWRFIYVCVELGWNVIIIILGIKCWSLFCFIYMLMENYDKKNYKLSLFWLSILLISGKIDFVFVLLFWV